MNASSACLCLLAAVVPCGGCVSGSEAPTPPPARVRVEAETPAADRPLARARALHRSGHDEAALELLAALVASDAPERRPALALAGVILARRGDLAAAEARLRQALEGDDAWPGAGAALHDLAVVRLRRGDEEEGLRLLDRAERVDLDAGDEALAERVRATRRRYLRYRADGGGPP